MHKTGGTHFQCVNNHFAKFEYKGIKSGEVTDYTNQTKMPKFNTPKNKEISLKYAQNRRHTSSMCKQSVCNVIKEWKRLELHITPKVLRTDSGPTTKPALAKETKWK